MDDDRTSFKVTGEDSKADEVKILSTSSMSTDDVNEAINDISITTNNEQDMDSNAAKAEAPLFSMPKRLSCKWTSPVGPRIGCVREYPIELQSQALEQVNLSPRVTPGRSGSGLPIPSPRPSPKIRVSPRLAYMGFPSPRVPVSTAAN